MNNQFEPINKLTPTKPKFFDPKKIIGLVIWATILIVIITISSRYIIKVDFTKMWELKGNHNGYKWLAIAFVLTISYFLYSIFGRIIPFWIKIRKIAPNIAVHSWLEFAVISIFIQIITPFSVGSEPYAIWWLKRKGVPVNHGTIVIGLNTFLWSFSQVLITWPSFIFFTITNHSKIANNKISWAYWLVLIGLMVDLFMMFFVFALNYSRHMHVFVARIFNQIKSLFHLKHSTKQEIIDKYKVNAFYKREFKQALFNKNSIVILLIMVGFAIFSYSLFIYLYTSYQNDNQGWQLFNIINVATTANNFLPLPGGGEGTIQYILIELLNTTVNTSIKNYEVNVNNAVFLWRAVTTYSLFFLGLISTIIVSIVKGLKQIINARLKA